MFKIKFTTKHLRGDILGGLTAGIVALPLALAFGVSSGLGPDAGLYGAIFISFFAALFGGTETQISGPTAPMTAVSMVVIAGIMASFNGVMADALPVILAVFLLAGLIQIGFGILGLGKYIKYMPYPVVSGFMTAIGLIILITQILPAVGYYAENDTALIEKFKPQAEEIILDNILKDEAAEGYLVLEDFQETIKRSGEVTNEQIMLESTTLAKSEASGVLGTFKVLPRALSNINWLELLLALGTIFIIYGFKRITTVIPSALVALFVMTGIAVGFGLGYVPIKEIPSGFPKLQLDIFTNFNLSVMLPYVLTAATLAVLGAIDSLLTSLVADNLTKTRHRPNQELVGQGIGNSIAAMFGGIPGAGATIRTVVNINSGGHTRISGMVAGLLLITILLALGPLASKIPAAVLAGILITVGIGVIDYKGLRALKTMPKHEIVILFTVMILSTFWDLVFAVGIGLVMASIMFMKTIADITTEKSEVSQLSESQLKEQNYNLSAADQEKIAIKEIKGPLFFGFINDFQDLAMQIPDSAQNIVMDVDRMFYIDQSGLNVLEDTLKDWNDAGKQVYLVHLHDQPKQLLEKVGIIPNLLPYSQIEDSIGDCIEKIKSVKLDDSSALEYEMGRV